MGSDWLIEGCTSGWVAGIGYGDCDVISLSDWSGVEFGVFDWDRMGSGVVGCDWIVVDVGLSGGECGGMVVCHVVVLVWILWFV